MAPDPYQLYMNQLRQNYQSMTAQSAYGSLLGNAIGYGHATGIELGTIGRGDLVKVKSPAPPTTKSIRAELQEDVDKWLEGL